MRFVTKFFKELTSEELYELLRARAAIFVVEQNCVYQDLDGIDYESLHVFYEDAGCVRAYLRAFETEEGVVKIGRVLTMEHGVGLGGMLLKHALERIKEVYHPKKIYVDAQSYAMGYYAREGFAACSEEFMEDGIPHVRMELVL